VVVDHFHAIKLANAVVDQVRRRVQQATLGHRGRKPAPLYRSRKLLLTAAEQLTSQGRVRLRAGLTAGDPTGEVAVAWQGKELLRTVDAASDLAHVWAALAHFYRWADGVQVPELSRLARTIRVWEAEILAWHATGGLLQRVYRGGQPADQEREAGGARLPQLRQLPAAVAVALRPQVADALNREPARPLPTLGGVAHASDLGSPPITGSGGVGRRASRPARVGPDLLPGVRPPQGIGIVP
jgi:hypothetical protein